MIEWIIAYRFPKELRYWSAEYGWTANITEATRFTTEQEAYNNAYQVGAFTVRLVDGEINEE